MSARRIMASPVERAWRARAAYQREIARLYALGAEAITDADRARLTPLARRWSDAVGALARHHAARYWRRIR